MPTFQVMVILSPETNLTLCLGLICSSSWVQRSTQRGRVISSFKEVQASLPAWCFSGMGL